MPGALHTLTPLILTTTPDSGIYLPSLQTSKQRLREAGRPAPRSPLSFLPPQEKARTSDKIRGKIQGEGRQPAASVLPRAHGLLLPTCTRGTLALNLLHSALLSPPPEGQAVPSPSSPVAFLQFPEGTATTLLGQACKRALEGAKLLLRQPLKTPDSPPITGRPGRGPVLRPGSPGPVSHF